MPTQHTLKILTHSLSTAALFCGLIAFPTQLTAQAGAPTDRSLSAGLEQPYKIIDRWKIGGDGGWDYLLADPPAHRLYLTRGARVEVLDTLTGKSIGTIANLHGTHGIALDTAGQNPDGIVFEPATQTVWAFNGRSHDVSVINAATLKVVATIPLPGKPEFPAIDGKGTVFDNIEDKSEIVRLNAKSKTVTAVWPLTGCDGPSGLAFDTRGHRLFPVCDGKKMGVIDSRTGKVLTTPTICDGPDAAGWDATHKLAFASCNEGILSVIDAASPNYPTIESLPTQRSARTMAYDSAADRIYLSAAEFGSRPDPTPDNPHPRPTIVPGSFTILVVGR